MSRGSLGGGSWLNSRNGTLPNAAPNQGIRPDDDAPPGRVLCGDHGAVTMGYWGKFIGGMAGFAMGGPVGAVVGVALGHAADSSGGARMELVWRVAAKRGGWVFRADANNKP